MVPPCSRTSSCTSARPMPVPSWVRARAPCTRWKRSNMRGSSVGGNADAGVADARARRGRRRARSATRISPSNVNLNAFDSRLRTIFSHIVAVDVDRLAAAAGSRPSSRRPARSTAERKTLGELGGERGEIGRLVARPATRPASMREKSSSVLTSLSSRSALRCTDRKQLAVAGRSASGDRPARPRAGRASASAACGTRG